ncbi:MAG: holo-ACP synthase [Chitinophagaceae bacterium]
MIKGLGTDIVEVDRIAEKITSDSGFKELVFSKNEIDYCEQQKFKAEHYAARFAAKEAFFKALGTGWASGTHFNEIEIQHDAAGKPFLNFLGETKKTFATLQQQKISVSLSHTKTMATAIVIIED